MITLNLNGGTLNGASGTITEQYYEGDVIVMPKPSRSGYTFRYWKGSEYRAGEKYTVTEDHTFVAQWCVQERYEPAPKDENSGTGTVSVPQTQTRAQVVNTSDNTHILMWSFLFVISLLLGGSSALILRSGKSRL